MANMTRCPFHTAACPGGCEERGWCWAEGEPPKRGATGHGCYLCRLDDPLAEEEGCSDCEEEFFKNPVFVYLEGGC